MYGGLCYFYYLGGVRTAEFAVRLLGLESGLQLRRSQQANCDPLHILQGQLFGDFDNQLRSPIK